MNDKMLKFSPLSVLSLSITIKLLVLSLLPMIFVGCKDGELDVMSSYINVSDHELEFTNAGGNYKLEVFSDGRWEFIYEDGWVTSQKIGLRDEKVTIEVKPNITGKRRETTIKIRALNPVDVDNQLKAEIKVVQTDRLTEAIEGKRFYFSDKAGVRDLVIPSTDDFEVESLVSWMKVTDKIKRGSFTTLKIDVQANVGLQREGVLQFTSSGESQILFSGYQWSDAHIEIEDAEGGGLRQLFSSAGESDAKKITITGKVDNEDVRVLSEMVERVTLLDMGGADVVAGFDKLTMDFNRKEVNGDKCTLILPQGLREIGGLAFSHATLYKEIIIPNSLSDIGSFAFRQTELESLDLSHTQVKRIEQGAFNGMTATEIMLPNGLEVIGGLVFINCINLKKIEIPETVKEIGVGAFVDCESLEKLVLPSALVSVGRMLSNNPVLKELIIPGGVKRISGIYQSQIGVNNQLDKMIIEGVPFNLDGVEKIIIPAGSLSAYQSAPVWKDYTNYIEM